MSRLAAILCDFDGLVPDTETAEYLTVAESFADHVVASVAGLDVDRLRSWFV